MGSAPLLVVVALLAPTLKMMSTVPVVGGGASVTFTLISLSFAPLISR